MADIIKRLLPRFSLKKYTLFPLRLVSALAELPKIQLNHVQNMAMLKVTTHFIQQESKIFIQFYFFRSLPKDTSVWFLLYIFQHIESVPISISKIIVF